jgi:hypothetical protein
MISLRGVMDCLAEPVIGRAFARPEMRHTEPAAVNSLPQLLS